MPFQQQRNTDMSSSADQIAIFPVRNARYGTADRRC